MEIATRAGLSTMLGMDMERIRGRMETCTKEIFTKTNGRARARLILPMAMSMKEIL